MKYFILLLILSGIGLNNYAQNAYRDSVVQLYGVVMTADSLRAIPSASIIVVGKGRGTVTTSDGVFSIAVLKGDKITFSCVGFVDKSIVIPADLNENQYTVFTILSNDTAFLPAVVLKPRVTREQFERDFINNDAPDDDYEIARKNTSEAQRRILLSTLPADGREAVNFQMRQQANKYYYNGQLPPINLLNPAAWASFIQSWKRGDFKKKRS
jgi:CarboxypepD_reg-like domain